MSVLKRQNIATYGKNLPIAFFSLFSRVFSSLMVIRGNFLPEIPDALSLRFTAIIS
jgi:hypothetical protein